MFKGPKLNFQLDRILIADIEVKAWNYENLKTGLSMPFGEGKISKKIVDIDYRSKF